MATFSEIKNRIISKYQSLPTQRERLEFLFQVQERLRTVHNNRGTQFRDGVIDEDQWEQFKSQWNPVNGKVAEIIANLREKVFVEDYGLTIPNEKDSISSTIWINKKQELKDSIVFKNDIDTIWL